jgi:hypothetical protein
MKFTFFAIILCAAISAAAQTPMKFAFGSGKPAANYKQVQTADIYSKEKGYGFEPNADVKCSDKSGKLSTGFCSSDKPFYFSAAVPEGNYKVTVTFGDKTEATQTTVKAELRRLMLENVETAKGKFATESLIVNVRTPQFPGGEVKLKDREKGSEAWAERAQRLMPSRLKKLKFQPFFCSEIRPFATSRVNLMRVGDRC